MAGWASGLADWCSGLAGWASGLAGWPRGGNGRRDERKISPFYRTLSPIGAAAQKASKGEGEERDVTSEVGRGRVSHEGVETDMEFYNRCRRVWVGTGQGQGLDSFWPKFHQHDRPTNKPKDIPTDRVTYRVACKQLKKSEKENATLIERVREGM